MKKFCGKYCTVIWKPIKINQQKLVNELIKMVNQIRIEKGLELIEELDSDDWDQGWQNMSAKDRIELKMRKWEKQQARRKK